MVSLIDAATDRVSHPSGETYHALKLLGAASFLLTDETRFTWQDPSLCKSLLRIHDKTPPETARDWGMRLSRQDSRRRSDAISQLSWDGAQYALRYKVKLGDARWLWIEERGERLSGQGGIAHEISGVILNIQAAQEAQDRAAYLAGHDDLTGLWNAARFTGSLSQLTKLAERYNMQTLCLRLSLSNLADINETYGYDQGDRFLKMIAERLSNVVSAPDITARVSGRSFAIGLSGKSVDDIQAIAANIQTALSDELYQSPHGPLKAEFTAASTIVSIGPITAAQALSQTALAVKAPSHHQPAAAIKANKAPAETLGFKDVITADDILAALNDRRISLAFQPIIEAKSRILHHYECLLRLRLEGGEVISAGRFIMAAERLGLVHLLDRRALELAREALRQYSDIHIALNVSAGTLKEAETAAAYMAALKALGPDTQRVSLELTETAALEDPAKASRFSVEARSLGCEFAIDDFGSGYTTFQNLMAIEADVIKIDGSFIEGIARTPHKETFVRMMVDLAQTFGVKTVAEMVDSRADADLLERLGVDYLQGYMFGIPSAAPAWRQAS